MTIFLFAAFVWLVAMVTRAKKWAKMTRLERLSAIRQIVLESESEGELHRRLYEIGCVGPTVDWLEVLPNDIEAQKARDYYNRNGLLISKNGALVSVVGFDGDGY